MTDSRRPGHGLRRDLALLEALASDEAQHAGGLGVQRIAELTGREKSQVSRALRALAEEGIVERDADSLQYRLGWRLFSLVARTAESRLTRAAEPAAHRLAAGVEQTVHLCVLRDAQVLTLLTVSAHSFRRHGFEGRRVPPACTSAGRVLLLDATPDDLYVRFGAVDDLTPDRPGSPVHTLPQLWERVEAARRLGWAEVRDEFEPGLSGVSAPVRDFRGRVVAALNVVGPTARIGHRLHEIGPHTAAAADEVSAELGWSPGRRPRAVTLPRAPSRPRRKDDDVVDPSPDLRPDVPHGARIWNYWLGGTDNFAADREIGDAVLAAYPSIPQFAVRSREFLARAVRHLAGIGLRQFLDVGSGLPTMQNTHQVAQAVAADARVVYVDSDPLVLAHAQELLGTAGENGRTVLVDADYRDPAAIVARAGETLDLRRPVAVLCMGVFGYVHTATEARAVIDGLLRPMPSGSHLALWDGTDTSEAARAAARAQAEMGSPYELRRVSEIEDWFSGLDLLEPGVVPVTRWRPDGGSTDDIDAYGGVARKP